MGSEKVRLIDNLILLSLCALIVGLPFSNSIVEIAASIAIILWLFKKAFILHSFKLENTPLNKPILFYLVFITLSFINTQFLTTSLKGFFFKTIEHILLFFIIAETVNTERRLKTVISAILFSCALMGIDGLWQYFMGYDFLRGYPIFSLKRVAASFKFPNGFAGWLITVIPLCVSLAVFDIKEKLYKLWAVFLIPLLFACLILTFNKGAWVAFVPAIIFLAWKKGNIGKKVLLLLLIMALAGIGVIAVFGNEEFISLYLVKAHSAFHRIELTRLCLRMFKDHPFLGHGINTFMSIYERYLLAYGVSVMSGISYAHNCFLQIAVETGIFSLIAFLWILGALFISSLNDINRRKEGFIKASQIGLLAALLAYLMHSALDTDLYALPLAILFYYFLGLIIGIQKIKTD